MAYAVELAPTAEAQLAALPAKARRQAASRIEALKDDPRPHGSLKLQGRVDLYRIRAGNYRVIYQIRDAALVVLVLKVADRKDVYRGL